MASRYPPLALPAISQPASIEASHSPSAAGWTAVALANGPVRGHLAQTGIRAMLSSGLSSGAAPPAAAACAAAACAAAACAATGRSLDGTLVDRELDRSGAARAEHQAAAERSRLGVARQPDAEQVPIIRCVHRHQNAAPGLARRRDEARVAAAQVRGG